MDALKALAQLGIHLGEGVSDDVARKVLEIAEKRAKDTGRVIVSPEKEAELGRVLMPTSRKTSLDEMKQAADQVSALRRERNAIPSSVEASSPSLEEIKQASEQADVMKKEGFTTEAPIENRKRTIKEMMDELSQVKENLNTDKTKKAAGMLAMPLSAKMKPVDMNPLEDIKYGYDQYKKAKDAVNDKLAEQLDLTPNKDVKQNLKGALNLVVDPINLTTGPVGMGLGALQMGLDTLPSKEKLPSSYDNLMKLLKNNQQK
jgi:hypothetical protein